jgi:outer membrane protein OmpA-like peptidoglycan-associated protein
LVTVTMLGDFTYKPVTALTSITFLCKLIAQAPLAITSSGSTSVTLGTTGGSGSGAVSYSVTDGTANCVLSGNIVTAAKTGTCVVAATKAADDVYEAATASATVTVTAAKPIIVTPPQIIKVDPVKHVVAVAPTGKPVLTGTPLIKPIIFGPDSAKLDAGDLAQLRAAATLAKSKNMDVLITGFVKSAGATTLIEKLLASSRARVVATYLRKLGVKVAIAYAGYGAYNKTSPSANDRRVEIRWIVKD